MTPDARTFEERTMDICPYFTQAHDNHGQAAHQIPSGYFQHASLPSKVEIAPGETVRFSLRAHDAKGRGIIFERIEIDRETEFKTAGSDETVEFEWAPRSGRFNHSVTFRISGDYEGQHREGNTDQIVSFQYQTFPTG